VCYESYKLYPSPKHDTLASNSGIEGTFWSQIVPTYGSLFIPNMKRDLNETEGAFSIKFHAFSLA
jgi:hypothetical protein